MNNNEFLEVLKRSYFKYLEFGERSNEKLKVLHGAIANDLKARLGNEFIVRAYGIGDEREGKLSGRYMDKTVDISVVKRDRELGGVAVKYIMSNYSQNSNNYFESMLGETANIRSSEKAYFQIIVLPEQLPYYSKSGEITKIEIVTPNNLSKYIKLSNDNTNAYLHTPNKTLFYLIKTPNIDRVRIKTKEQLTEFLYDNLTISASSMAVSFGHTIIHNDYNDFITKIAHHFLSM